MADRSQLPSKPAAVIVADRKVDDDGDGAEEEVETAMGRRAYTWNHRLRKESMVALEETTPFSGVTERGTLMLYMYSMVSRDRTHVDDDLSELSIVGNTNLNSKGKEGR
ncbi:hypothetical protein Ancab_002350 [Ancistrocladus abbreviatus]